jgi:hypothetical protein
MAYQPTPFSLIMPEVPAHITDGEIARLWGEPLLLHCGHSMINYIRSIQMDPFVDNGKRWQRVTIHFDDFPRADIRQQIENGYYETNIFKFPASVEDYLINRSYLLPCETPQPPRTEYSHMVALQLQDVVRKQAEQIRMLEARLNEMETMIQEGTKLQLDINQSNTEEFDIFSKRLEDRTYELEKKIQGINDVHVEEFDQLEPRLQSHKEYSNDIHDMIIALEAKREAENKLHAEEYAALNNKLAAVIDWCSQPVWRRKFAAFISPK